QRTYGTTRDHEYVPFGRRPPLVMASYSVGALLLPMALAVRFAILAPLSWIVPPLRRLVVDRFSALVINHRYVRQAPIDRAGRVQEAAAAALVWVAIGLWAGGVVQAAAFACWYVVTTLAATVNVVRTLAS